MNAILFSCAIARGAQHNSSSARPPGRLEAIYHHVECFESVRKQRYILEWKQ